MSKKIIAIVPAAGVGQRATARKMSGKQGSDDTTPKQYRLIKNKPMLRWSVEALLADTRIAQVRVVVARHDPWAQAALIGLEHVVCRPVGGLERVDSVTAGLADAELANDDWVMVHDAARPGLPLWALQALIDTCLAGNEGGILALPVADTVKKAQHTGESTPSENCVLTGAAGKPAEQFSVQETLSREFLWLAQTPQMFPAGLLRKALIQAQKAGVAVTDEASAVEQLGLAPRLVTGDPRNFKVTWPSDFNLMEKWL